MKLISTPVALISAALTWRWTGQKRMDAGVAPAHQVRSSIPPVAARRPEVPLPSPPVKRRGPEPVAIPPGAAARIAALEAALRERDGEIAALRACLAGGASPLGRNASAARKRRRSTTEAPRAAAAAQEAPPAAVVPAPEPQPEAIGSAMPPAEEGPAPSWPPAAGAGSDVGDPFTDATDAAWRVLVLLQDMAAFMLESTMEHVCPWPADSSTALPQIDVTAFAALFRAVYQSVQKVDTELPPDVAARLSDVQAALGLAAGRLQVGLRAAAEDAATRVEAKLSPEALAHYRGLRSSLAAAWSRAAAAGGELASELAAAAQAVRRATDDWLRAFLERHPEHRAGLAGRDPLLVAAAALPSAWVLAWRALSLLKVLLLALRGPVALLRFALRLLSLPVRCCLCRRGRASQASGAEEKLRQLPDDTDGISPAAQARGRKTSLRASSSSTKGGARKGGA